MQLSRCCTNQTEGLRIRKMMKFMNEKGEILEGTPVSEAKVKALEFLEEGLKNDTYQHLGIRYFTPDDRTAILKFVAKNFLIERIFDPELAKAEESQQSAPMSETDNITF